jgi:hypothetical protein
MIKVAFVLVALLLSAIFAYSKHTYDKYVRTKNASNGGDNSCPSNGTRANWKTVIGGGNANC